MLRKIFTTTAIAGTLDIVAACTQAYLAKSTLPAIVLKYIASGIIGKEAFSGGIEIAILGLLIHYFIAFSCTLCFFLVYPKLKLLHKSIWLNAFLISIIAWAVTTRIIIPLSKIQPGPFILSKVMIAISILYFCIGLPIAYFTKRYYSSKQV